MLRTTLAILIILVLIGSVFLPIDVPYTFESVARVYPAREWILSKQLDGTLVSSLHDYRTGLMQDYANYQFERGDVVQIRFNPDRIAETPIDSGTLVATIRSNDLNAQLIQTQNALSVEQAQLRNVAANDKDPVILLAESQLQMAEAQVIFQRQQLDRAQKMLDEGLLAPMDFERIEQNYIQAMARVDVAKRNIIVFDTGDKPEEIQLVRAKIKALQKELNFLDSTTQIYELYSPIPGNMRFETGPAGDQLIVEDTLEYVLMIPVLLKDRPFVDQQSTIDLQLVGRDSSIRAELLEVTRKTIDLNQRVVVLAKARIAGIEDGISVGMPIACKVSCGKVRILEYLKRSMKFDWR